LDELDVKLFRALVSESLIAPSNVQTMSSLREIARKLGSDDMTVRNRFKKLQEAGCMSIWNLIVNPTFFGYRGVGIRVEAQPESAKADMVRKLRLIHGVVSLVNYLGAPMRIMLLYDTDESRSRSIELISRITNAEKVTLFKFGVPRSETKRLTETDVAIIRTLATDARKPNAIVAKELGLSSRTVRNRVEKLRRDKTLFTLPELKVGNISGLIPADLSYSYTNVTMKDSVDRAMLSHFDPFYLWGGLSDPENGYLVLSLPNMGAVHNSLDWAKEQYGVASAHLDIPIECISFPDKFGEFLGRRRPEELTVQKNA
jgi:DNA-binding Lrp family transcriptional regulator